MILTMVILLLIIIMVIVVAIIVAALCQDCCLPGTWYLTFCGFDKKDCRKIRVLDLGDIFAYTVFAGKLQQLYCI